MNEAGDINRLRAAEVNDPVPTWQPASSLLSPIPNVLDPCASQITLFPHLYSHCSHYKCSFFLFISDTNLTGFTNKQLSRIQPVWWALFIAWSKRGRCEGCTTTLRGACVTLLCEDMFLTWVSAWQSKRSFLCVKARCVQVVCGTKAKFRTFLIFDTSGSSGRFVPDAYWERYWLGCRSHAGRVVSLVGIMQEVYWIRRMLGNGLNREDEVNRHSWAMSWRPFPNFRVYILRKCFSFRMLFGYFILCYLTMLCVTYLTLRRMM